MRTTPLPARTPSWQRAWLAVLGAAGVALVLFGTSRHGVGLTSDSATYFASADSVVLHGRFERYDGRVMTGHPPLFALLLAAASRAGLSMAQAARVLNAAAFGTLLGAAGLLLRRQLRSPALWAAGTLAVALVPALADVAVMAWSEPVFILLCVLALHDYLAAPTRTRLGLLAVCGSLMCLQRWAGMPMICCGVVFLLLPHAGLPVFRRIGRAGLLVLVGAGPVVAWLVRNAILTESAFSGYRRAGAVSPEPVLQCARVMGAWIVPLREPVPLAAGLVILACMAAYVGWLGPSLLRGEFDAESAARAIPCVFALGYVAFILVAGVRVWVTVDDRMLSPVAPFLPGLVLSAAAGGDRSHAPARGPRLRPAALTAGAVWLVCAGTWLFTATAAWWREGAGEYNRPAWRASPLMGALHTVPPDAPLFSNVPDGIYLLTGRRAKFTPHHTLPLTADALQAAFPGERPALVAWFFTKPRRFLLHPIDAVRAVVPMEPVVTLDDGVIYRMP